MKDITEVIDEVRLSESILSKKPGIYGTRTDKTEFPKNRSELTFLIGLEIEKHGNLCSLNHIDVSGIEDFSDLFNGGHDFGNFNGDISGWDMSNAVNCTRMFYRSSYTGENGDITSWNMDNVTHANQMFYMSKYNGDISTWALPKLDKRNAVQFIGGAAIAKNRKNWPKKFR